MDDCLAEIQSTFTNEAVCELRDLGAGKVHDALNLLPQGDGVARENEHSSEVTPGVEQVQTADKAVVQVRQQAVQTTSRSQTVALCQWPSGSKASSAVARVHKLY